jgi:hypothetical protein
MSEKNPAELRGFERHALEFGIEVYTVLDETKVLIESTVLENVSGGGVCFVSRRPDLYSIGQRVFLHICMPGTDEMDAGMECMARVAWMHQAQSGEVEKQRITIGVCMDGVLSFEKIVHDQHSVDQEPGQWP